MTSMWDGMNEAEADGRVYFQAGIYVIAIERCKAIETHESFRGYPSFVVECTILASTCPALPPGTQSVGWVQPFKQGKNLRALAQTSVKRFLQAAFRDENLKGIPSEKLAPVVTGESNPLRGVQVGLVCTSKRLRDNSGDFTKHQWEAMPANTPLAFE